MASITVTSSGYWGNDGILASGSWAALAYNDTVTIQDGAVCTIDPDQQTPTGIGVGVNVVCTSSFSKFVINNTGSTVLTFYGAALGSVQIETGCSWEITGALLPIQKSGGGDWTGDVTASQSIATGVGYGWTGLGFDVADEPVVLFVETGSGTGVFEPWMNISDLSLSLVGGKSGGVSELGNWFSYNPATGVITFGDGGSGTDGTGGNVVPSGATVKTYNVCIGSHDASSPYINATQTNNCELDTANGGRISFNNCWFSGFFVNATYASEIVISSVGILIHWLTLSNSKNISIDSLYICADRYTADNTPPVRCQNVSNVTFNDSIIVSYLTARAYQCDQCGSMIFNSCKFIMLARSNSYNYPCWVLSGVSNAELNECDFIGSLFFIDTSSDVTLSNCRHSDSPNGLVNANGGLRFSAASSYNCTINGLTDISDGHNGTSGTLISGFKNVFNVEYDCSGVQYPITPPTKETCRIHNCNLNQSNGGTIIVNGNVAPALIVENMHLNTIVNELLPSYNAVSDGFVVKGYDCAISQLKAMNATCVDTHFFEIRTDLTNNYGWMGLWFAPKKSTSSAYSITGTGIKFNGSGRLYIADDTSEIIYTWPHVVKGITGFLSAVSPVLSGSGTGNFTIEYKIDTGSGFGASWQTLTSANLGAETVSAGTIFGFMVRIMHSTGSLSDYLDLIRWATTNDYATYKYPEELVDITLQNIVDGSRYYVYNVTTDEEVATGLQSGAVDIIIPDVPYSGSNETLLIRVRKASGSPLYKWYSSYATLTANGATIWVEQQLDT